MKRCSIEIYFKDHKDSWLYNAQYSLHTFLFFVGFFFIQCLISSYRHRQQNVSLLKCKDLIKFGPYHWDKAAQFPLSLFTQLVFSLRNALPICEQHSGTISTRALTGSITINLKCARVCLCSALAFATCEEKSQCLECSDWSSQAQEMLKGLLFRTFTQNWTTLMKEWKEGFAGWAKSH